ncbi:MAG: RsmE family RNA methyltransferase [Acidimicrobiales bacterium]
MSLIEWERRVAALAQFTVEDPERPTLTRDDEHHLRVVLRAQHGEEVVVTNGRGAWALCQVGDAHLTRVSSVYVDRATPETTLFMVPLKGDRSEWVVAKATEVGVSRIVPLLSERMIVKFKGDTRDKVLARWRRIAREAGGQCRRTYEIAIGDPVHVRDLAEDVAVADFNGDADWNGVRAVAIGPEGGWGRGEWGDTRRRLSLGPSVLRAETAGVVASSLLAFGAGGWGFTLTGPRDE